MQSVSPASVSIVHEASQTRLVCSGLWTIKHLPDIERELNGLLPKNLVIWDFSGVCEFDSSGIALWQLYTRIFESKGHRCETIGGEREYTRLLKLLYTKPLVHNGPLPLPSWLYRLGKGGYEIFRGAIAFLTFLGEAFVWFFHTLRHPGMIRYRSIGVHILETGAKALPIIAISAFLIGVVVAYQSVVQLQKFGADIFIVDMIGISLTRELSPLITAIVVAGRSGSAFTAQIGTMKMTQEIDAMKTMGFDPFIFLVWPRVIALMIIMPLLIFFADMVGIFGGMVIANLHSHLSFSEFIHRLQGALALKHYLIGLIKGPFFAFLIAFVSTYRGFQVSLNTESIGRYTTKSVVNAIFLVIACDALFSVLLTELKL